MSLKKEFGLKIFGEILRNELFPEGRVEWLTELGWMEDAEEYSVTSRSGGDLLLFLF